MYVSALLCVYVCKHVSALFCEYVCMSVSALFCVYACTYVGMYRAWVVCGGALHLLKIIQTDAKVR